MLHQREGLLARGTGRSCSWVATGWGFESEGCSQTAGMPARVGYSDSRSSSSPEARLVAERWLEYVLKSNHRNFRLRHDELKNLRWLLDLLGDRGKAVRCRPAPAQWGHWRRARRQLAQTFVRAAKRNSPRRAGRQQRKSEIEVWTSATKKVKFYYNL